MERKLRVTHTHDGRDGVGELDISRAQCHRLTVAGKDTLTS